jgi:hypothetical protein
VRVRDHAPAFDQRDRAGGGGGFDDERTQTGVTERG